MAADPQTGIITDEKLAKASGEETCDPAVAAEFRAAEAAGAGSGRDAGTGEDEALAWYGDSAYGTGELRQEIAAAGHRAVIKPKPVQPAVPGGFTVDDFTADEQAGTVTCPAGITRRITATRNVIFGAASSTCPLRARCTTSKSGRTMSLLEQDSLLRAARRDWPALREDYMRHRPNVERAVAQVATVRGRRLKLRCRGEAKNNAWLRYRTAALNLRNLIGKGLTRQAGTWALVT